MSTVHDQDKATHHSAIDTERLSEFIYGTITALIAVAATIGDAGVSWGAAAAVIVVGAAVVWLAHGYSKAIAARATTHQHLSGHDIGGILYVSWPIVIAGVVVAAPLLLSAIGLIEVTAALRISNVVGILTLALVGWRAGVASGDNLLHRLWLAMVSIALGLMVVALEFLLHH